MCDFTKKTYICIFPVHEMDKDCSGLSVADLAGDQLVNQSFMCEKVIECRSALPASLDLELELSLLTCLVRATNSS